MAKMHSCRIYPVSRIHPINNILDYSNQNHRELLNSFQRLIRMFTSVKNTAAKQKHNILRRQNA